MSLKEKLIRRISQEKNIPESVVTLVVDNMFKELVENIHKPGQFVLELPGFGKFKWRKTATEYKLKRLEENISSYEKQLLTVDEKKRDTMVKLMKDRKDSWDYIIGKVYGTEENRNKSNSGRMEEQSDSE